MVRKVLSTTKICFVIDIYESRRFYLRFFSSSELIAKKPEHTDYYAGIMAELALQIHSTRPDDGKLFPNTSMYIDTWIRRAELCEEIEKKLFEVMAARPLSECLVHGDLHTGNVFLSNNEPMFIDVDRMAIGDPIVDLSSIYLFYVGYSERDPKIIENFMGISSKTAEEFYYSFIRQYLKTDDETEIEKAIRSSSLWAYVRLIGQMKKKSLSEKDEQTVALLTEKNMQFTGAYSAPRSLIIGEPFPFI